MLSLQLADFGAEVVKIEPLEGDPQHAWRDGGQQLFYSPNKMPAALNLRMRAATRHQFSLIRFSPIRNPA
jgi:crotonobetainyl-CoA:carnitine CoA-transferase CaiB-like acyl-CoA transferase